MRMILFLTLIINLHSKCIVLLIESKYSPVPQKETLIKSNAPS
jgi:hypothetical protein